MFLVPTDIINSKGYLKVRKFYDKRSHRLLNSYFINDELTFTIWNKNEHEKVFYSVPERNQKTDKDPGIPFGAARYLARLVFYDSCPRGHPVKMYHKRKFLEEFEDEEKAVEVIRAYAKF